MEGDSTRQEIPMVSMEERPSSPDIPGEGALKIDIEEEPASSEIPVDDMEAESSSQETPATNKEERPKLQVIPLINMVAESTPQEFPAIRNTLPLDPLSLGMSSDGGLPVDMSPKVSPSPSPAKRKHKCEMCGKCFTTNSNLWQHRRTHTGEKPYSCNECGKSFGAKSHLMRHKNIHTGERPFPCEICGKCFHTSSNLSEHKKIHTDEREFSCSDCGKSFRSISNLSQHRKIHSGEKPFFCGECGKSFGAKSHLLRHMIIHSGERPFCCELCGKTFPSSSRLSEHRKIHSDIKPTCDECGKEFISNSELSKHMRIHTGIFPHYCSVCGKGFNAKSYLLRHEKIHLYDEPFSCQVCGMRFLKKSMLLAHKKSEGHIEKPSSPTDCMERLSQQVRELSEQQSALADIMPQWPRNESTDDLTYVGINPKESSGDLPVKEEGDPIEALPVEVVIKEEIQQPPQWHDSESTSIPNYVGMKPNKSMRLAHKKSEGHVEKPPSPTDFMERLSQHVRELSQRQSAGNESTDDLNYVGINPSKSSVDLPVTEEGEPIEALPVEVVIKEEIQQPPQWLENEGTSDPNYVGINPKESLEDLPAKKENDPMEAFPVEVVIKEEIQQPPQWPKNESANVFNVHGIQQPHQWPKNESANVFNVQGIQQPPHWPKNESANVFNVQGIQQPPQWPKNESTNILNYVGINPTKSLETFPVKEERNPREVVIKKEEIQQPEELTYPLEDLAPSGL